MKDLIAKKIAIIVKDVFNLELDAEASRPDPQFGDVASNVAMRLTKQLGKPPREIAEAVAERLSDDPEIEQVTIAGPGFINVRVGDETLWRSASAVPETPLKGQVIVAEYSDPNPFKALHAGHLYTSLAGDAISRLMERAGAQVHRVNFGGDVGLHVGKTMWAIIDELGGEHPEKLADIPDDQKLAWVTQRYVAGNTAYETDEKAKEDIIAANKRVYELHEKNERDSPFARIYWTCRQWSYDGFDYLYEQLQMKPFDKYYPESSVTEKGVEVVKAHTGDVYEISDGAVVFKGEKYGLFTQVFISSEGISLYAAKDVGLIYHKARDFSPDRSFIITDFAQKDHLAVVMKSIEQFEPKLVESTTHFTHGRIKLAGGVKISSRKGNGPMAIDILTAATEANKKNGREDIRVELGAVKYSMLKQRIGGDIVYDPQESVSLEGNSGPYLQYAHARARSIVGKAGNAKQETQNWKLDSEERKLVLKLSEWSEVLALATNELMPHHICTYLYELSQVFNRFYEHSRVIGDEREAVRLQLVLRYADTLREGLGLLGIPAPEKL